MRKAVKVTEVNCIGSGAGGNGGRGEPRVWEVLDFSSWREQAYC